MPDSYQDVFVVLCTTSEYMSLIIHKMDLEQNRKGIDRGYKPNNKFLKRINLFELTEFQLVLLGNNSSNSKHILDTWSPKS
jgi:hypothetical protein